MVLSTFTAKAGLSRLEALSMIETGDNDAAIGRAGEVSRYQIRPWIWRQYSPSSSYADRRTSRQVAERHLAVLQTSFRDQTRREPTDFDLYVLWNAGPTYYARIGFSKSRVHPVIRERARRYANLCHRPAEAMARVEPQQPAPPTVPPPQSVAIQPVQSKPAVKLGVPWPVFADSPASSLQNPLFPVLPLTSRPSVTTAPRQPIFAIGGFKAE